MVIRPDRRVFWDRYGRLFRRLGIIIPAAFMVTLLLIAFDWSGLRVFHVEWLLTVATLLLVLLWCGVAIALLLTVLTEVALRVDRLELVDGRLTRHLMLQRMHVLVDGATLRQIPITTIVSGAGGKGRVLIPHLFYAQADRDRLLGAAGLAEPAAMPPG